MNTPHRSEVVNDRRIRTSIEARRTSRRLEVVGGCTLLIGAIVAWTPRAEAATPVPAPLVICMGQAVPTGQVITAISHTAKCGSASGPNTMTLKSYVGLKSFTACAPVNIPGFLLTSASTTAACQGINVVVNDRTVTMPTYNTATYAAYEGVKALTVCAPLSSIPQGYVVTAHSTKPGCNPMTGALTAWNAMTLTNYTGLATFTACSPVSPIPSGYVVTAQTRTAACGGPVGVNAVTLKKI